VAQVFSNLIGNALKFTPSSGRIRVSASRSATGVRFVVEDTGPGIAASDLPHVFDRFWQAQKKTRDGTGLGLSIAKASWKRTGGRSASTVRSEPARVSTSRFPLRSLRRLVEGT
jgi:signal transduction histidine kinase